MKPKFNYIVLLSLFSLPAFLIFVDESFQGSIGLSFAYLLYLGYVKVPMDELFHKRVQQSASLTLLVVLFTMTGYLISLMFVKAPTDLIFGGFWVAFTWIHVVFNLLLSIFLILDARATQP